MYYNARYYDPTAGRFTQADTILDGLNRYTYVRNRPTNATDPTGHDMCAGGGGGCGGARQGDYNGDGVVCPRAPTTCGDSAPLVMPGTNLANPGPSTALVEFTVAALALAGCTGGVAASPFTMGTSAVVGCGTAATVIGGAAGNAHADRPLTDGLITDAALGAATTLAGIGAGKAVSAIARSVAARAGYGAAANAVDDAAAIADDLANIADDAAGIADDAVQGAVPDPEPQLLPNGDPNRDGPAAWVNAVDADGNVRMYASTGKPSHLHAEEVAQAAQPGSPMSRVWAGADRQVIPSGKKLKSARRVRRSFRRSYSLIMWNLTGADRGRPS